MLPDERVADRFVIFLQLNIILSDKVMFLSVHSCTPGITTGSAGGFASLSVIVFMDVSIWP